MQTVSKRSLAALGALLCLVLPPAIACSSTQEGAVCGKGTKLVNGACLPEGAAEAGLGDGGVLEDGAVEDSGEQPDVDTYDAGPDDPCPVIPPNAVVQDTEGAVYRLPDNSEHWVNCDRACGPVSSSCRESMCAPAAQRDRWMGRAVQGFGRLGRGKLTIRLPRDPWILQGGVCDPDLQERHPAPTVPNILQEFEPYVARNPQPRALFILLLGGHETTLQFNPGNDWTWRAATGARRYIDGSFSAFDGRFEPLFDSVSALGPHERDRKGCEMFSPTTDGPYGIDQNSGTQALVLFTDLPHIRATNIVFFPAAQPCPAR